MILVLVGQSLVTGTATPFRLRSERVGYARDLDASGANDSGEHVEADLDVTRPPSDEPVRGGAPDAVLLDGVDGLDRRPEAIRAACLDLAEHYDSAPLQDDIDLPAAAPIVTVQHPVAAPSVVSGGKVFAGSAQPGARVHAPEVREGV